VPNKASGKNFSGAVNHGHWYAAAPNIGSLFEWSDFPPWDAYAVEPWWLDQMLKGNKLTRTEYLRCAAKCVIGFQRRHADVMASIRFQRELAVTEAVQAEQALVQQKMLAVKPFPEVATFVNLFRIWAFRRPIFVIVGPTGTGKSLLASEILRLIAEIVGVSSWLEVTVEDSNALDLVDFNRAEHSGVNFDGLGDAMILKRNRESLQGRAKIAKGAKSATNVYAYSYTFTRRAVIATMDLSAVNLDLLKTDHWLSNPNNVIVLEVKEPVWVNSPTVSGQASTDATGALRCWKQQRRV